jgi:plastocyanin
MWRRRRGLGSVGSGSSDLCSDRRRHYVTVIDVDERDFTIELSTTEFAPGTYTFVATKNGQTTHALKIEGQGLEETEDIAPGDSASLTVTLEAGEYEFYCPVGTPGTSGGAPSKSPGISHLADPRTRNRRLPDHARRVRDLADQHRVRPERANAESLLDWPRRDGEILVGGSEATPRWSISTSTPRPGRRISSRRCEC